MEIKRRIKEFWKKIKKTKIYKIIEYMFTPGTYESFLLHESLLLINIFLTILMIIELILIFVFHIHWGFFHKIDFFFGVTFLIESILRILYVYLPNKIFFRPHIWINWIVIISLIWPNLFFNLAFLRIIRSLKVLKIYWYNKETKAEKKDEYDDIFYIIWKSTKFWMNFWFKKIKKIFK